MKWFLCALCCLTEGLSVLRAQIMPDSSVQICAYWTPGDKYAYEAREEKFKMMIKAIRRSYTDKANGVYSKSFLRPRTVTRSV